MKFKPNETVAIKENPKFGLISIERIDYYGFHPGAYYYRLYNGKFYSEDELISQKEWEFNQDFDNLLDKKD